MSPMWEEIAFALSPTRRETHRELAAVRAAARTGVARGGRLAVRPPPRARAAPTARGGREARARALSSLARGRADEIASRAPRVRT